MNIEQKTKLNTLLHDVSFYLCGIHTVTGKGQYFIKRISSMIDELNETPNKESENKESQ